MMVRRTCMLLLGLLSVPGVWTLVGCTADNEAGGQDAMRERKEVLERLDRLGTKEFWLPTAIASGYNTVWDVLLDSEEVRWLSAHTEDVVPEILQRIRTQNIHNHTLIAYFAVLAESGDVRAIPALVEYVESLPETERRRNVSWQSHPFIYAMLALDKLAGLALWKPGELPSATELFDQRAEILRAIRLRLKNRPNP